MGKPVTSKDRKKNQSQHIKPKRTGSFNNGPATNQGVGSAANRRRTKPKRKDLRGGKPSASPMYGRGGRRRFASSM